MGMRELEEALDLIAAHEDEADFVGHREPSLVRRAEEALGVAFPPTYREFLLRLGCGDIAGAEFYGVVDEDFENSSVPDAIWMTLQTRRDVASTPASYIVVGALGEGSLYVIDTAQRDGEGESPVLIWLPSFAQEEEAPDFGTFLLNLVRTALEHGSSPDD